MPNNGRLDNLILIDVETLGEFAFCPNAGTIAYQRQGMKVERDNDRIPNLGYLPPFDHALHLERADELAAVIRRQLLQFGALIILVLIIGNYASLSLSFLVLLALIPMLTVLVRDALFYNEVLGKLRDYELALPIVLPDTAPEPVPISWWGLVKSGYAPITPRADMQDDEVGLSGKPWRILDSNTCRRRLPVITHFGWGDSKLKIEPHHRLRLAAYSHLSLAENAIADWGIVLDYKTQRGFAVPISSKDREVAMARLRSLQALIVSSKGVFEKQIPPSGACKTCRLAWPRKAGKKETVLGEKHLLPYFSSLDENQVDDSWDEDDDDYRSSRDDQIEENDRGPNRHSDCGDIFRWRPPHEFWEMREERRQNRRKSKD